MSFYSQLQNNTVNHGFELSLVVKMKYQIQKSHHIYQAVEKKMHIHDWHATILHLLGLDHERLTYRYAGRDFRLTDVHGEVAREILT